MNTSKIERDLEKYRIYFLDKCRLNFNEFNYDNLIELSTFMMQMTN